MRISDWSSDVCSSDLVRIVPEASRANDNAPSHRVMVGRAEIGAAWTKQSNEGRDYLGLKLDDPRFTAPHSANLFAYQEGTSLQPIWSRTSCPNGDPTDHPTPPPDQREGLSSVKHPIVLRTKNT